MSLSKLVAAVFFAGALVGAPLVASACTPGSGGVVLEKPDVDWTLAAYGLDSIAPGAQFAVEILLCDAPEETEVVEVGATMPTHGHGMNYKPEITRTNHGAFVTTGWLMHMSGEWEIAVKTRSGTEYATFVHTVTVAP